MSHTLSSKTAPEKVADIVRNAGGRIVGRTRLQKLAYFLELVGVGDGFDFEYRHYGPYSEDLASAAQVADFLDFLNEDEVATSWGGSYSVFTTKEKVPTDIIDARLRIAQLAAKADSIALELAATAAFLATEGHEDPWEETARRKPEKAEESRLANAKSLYRSLMSIEVPKPLPNIA
jgi:uncharacterized protein